MSPVPGNHRLSWTIPSDRPITTPLAKNFPQKIVKSSIGIIKGISDTAVYKILSIVLVFVGVRRIKLILLIKRIQTELAEH